MVFIKDIDNGEKVFTLTAETLPNGGAHVYLRTPKAVLLGGGNSVKSVITVINIVEKVIFCRDIAKTVLYDKDECIEAELRVRGFRALTAQEDHDRFYKKQPYLGEPPGP